MPSTTVSCCSDSMPLSDVLAEYLSSRDVSRGYRDSMQRTVRQAAAYGIKEARQLQPANVNGWLADMRERRVSAVTRSNNRRMLLTLWRYCYEQGYVDEPPLKVCRVKVSLPPPRAWSVETLMRLLDAAEKDNRPVTMRYPTLRWRHVLPAWITISFETGLRLGDVLALSKDCFRNGCVCVTASKTGKFEVKKISPYAQKAVAKLLAASPDGTVFRWAVTRRRALVKWKAWLKEHGISGSSKYLRRSSFTYTEIKLPGTAHRFANHSDPSLVWLHYIDRTLLAPPEGPDPLR